MVDSDPPAAVAASTGGVDWLRVDPGHASTAAVVGGGAIHCQGVSCDRPVDYSYL